MYLLGYLYKLYTFVWWVSDKFIPVSARTWNYRGILIYTWLGLYYRSIPSLGSTKIADINMPWPRRHRRRCRVLKKKLIFHGICNSQLAAHIIFSWFVFFPFLCLFCQRKFIMHNFITVVLSSWQKGLLLKQMKVQIFGYGDSTNFWWNSSH